MRVPAVARFIFAFEHYRLNMNPAKDPPSAPIAGDERLPRLQINLKSHASSRNLPPLRDPPPRVHLHGALHQHGQQPPSGIEQAPLTHLHTSPTAATTPKQASRPPCTTTPVTAAWAHPSPGPPRDRRPATILATDRRGAHRRRASGYSQGRVRDMTRNRKLLPSMVGNGDTIAVHVPAADLQ